MRLNLVFFALAFSFFGFSQGEKNSIYFPQEQLIHPECKNAEDKNQCLKNKTLVLLSPVINNALSYNKIHKDTLNVSVFFQVDKKGRLKDGSDFTFVNDSVFRKEYEKELRTITKRLPKFEILNRKQKPYISNHKLQFSFAIDKSNNSTQLISRKEGTYSGGVIEEVPKFPGCKRGDDQKARICFQKKMQKHIAENFRYPESAQAKGLQGKVNIMFHISKEGNIINMKVRGPHTILEEEAKRIIQLLPKFGPALHNGKAVRIPYSIPITFRLQ